jgi:Icc-related predicted phosphoesterase
MGLLNTRKLTSRSDKGRTICFASDLHGSEVCFKKFIAAARLNGADTLLLCSDNPDEVACLFDPAMRCTLLLAPHGQFHESGGSVTILRTTAINVGSEHGKVVLGGNLLSRGDGKLLPLPRV